MTSTKRALTALATGALALPFIYAPAAYAVAPEPPAVQDVSEFCSTIPADYNPFTDDEPNTFTEEIECVAFAGIALGGPRGLPANQYGPAFAVQRDQMASFIARMIDAADNLDAGDNITALPDAGANQFTDVPASNTHISNINRLAQADIARGGPGGAPANTYGPTQLVTRAQMASFINRAIAYMFGEDPNDAGTDTGLTTTNDYFTDDEAFANNHEPNINGIASAGIAVGDGRDTYRPTQFIQRDQMAGFLARTLAELFDLGLINEVSEDAANRPPVNPDENETIDVNANGAQGDVTLTGVQANPDNTAADNRTFTVTGLDAGEEYRITLVTCDSVVREADGDVVFDDADNDGLADTGNPTADITQVNGAAPTNNTGDGTAATGPVTNSAVATVPANGTITFTIDGDTAECVIPVVYYNGGGAAGGEGGDSPRLELDDDNTPSEEFGLGDRTTFTAAQQPTGAGTTGSTRPELVSAAIVSTTTLQQATDDPTLTAGTVVRYCFDENITGAAPDETLFYVYEFGNPNMGNDGDDIVRVEDNNTCVLVRFNDVDSAAEAGRLSLATIDLGAVTDVDGETSEYNDAPLGSTQTGTLTRGTTAAPDLLSITNCAAETINGIPTGNSRCTFNFDETAFTVDETGFFLITNGGDRIDCTAIGGAAGGQPNAGEQGGTSIVASCPNTPETGPIAVEDIARGGVEEATVTDDRAAQGDAVNCVETGDADCGNLNPLQTTGGRTDTPDRNSADPDLVAATIDFSDNTRDRLIYDFDVVVEPAVVEDGFCFYNADGTEICAVDIDGGNDQTMGAVTATRGTDTTTVVVSFPDGTLQGAVGASVQMDSVVAAAGQPGAGDGNEDDEEGVTNSTSFTQTAGQTSGPDLVSVALSSVTDQATGTTIRATYTFDEDVLSGSEDETKFFLVQGDGDLFVATACTVLSTANGGTEETDSQVRCTGFQETDDAGVATGVDASNSDELSAVIGAVDDDAVTSETGGETNPEGAARTSGGNGSIQQ